jgi:hypothetical protein
MKQHMQEYQYQYFRKKQPNSLVNDPGGREYESPSSTWDKYCKDNPRGNHEKEIKINMMK